MFRVRKITDLLSVKLPKVCTCISSLGEKMHWSTLLSYYSKNQAWDAIALNFANIVKPEIIKLRHLLPLFSRTKEKNYHFFLRFEHLHYFMPRLFDLSPVHNTKVTDLSSVKSPKICTCIRWSDNKKYWPNLLSYCSVN